MHMSCVQCRHEFCWLCRGDWKEHGEATGGFYKCNKYEQSNAKSEDESVNNLKTELETYLFYFHRYEAHRASLVSAKRKERKKERIPKREYIFPVTYTTVLYSL
jgi:ariadne-1